MVYCTIRYYTVLYGTILYYTVLYCTILYNIVLYCTILYSTVQYCTILYYTVLYYTILYYTIRYDTTRYDTIRYDTIRRWIYFSKVSDTSCIFNDLGYVLPYSEIVIASFRRIPQISLKATSTTISAYTLPASWTVVSVPQRNCIKGSVGTTHLCSERQGDCGHHEMPRGHQLHKCREVRIPLYTDRLLRRERSYYKSKWGLRKKRRRFLRAAMIRNMIMLRPMLEPLFCLEFPSSSGPS